MVLSANTVELVSVVLTDGVTIAVPPADAAVYTPMVEAEPAKVTLAFVTVTFRGMNCLQGIGTNVSPTAFRLTVMADPRGPRELPWMLICNFLAMPYRALLTPKNWATV